MLQQKYALILVLTLGVALSAATQGVEVIYSFGKIELLRQGNTEWQFLRKGDRLDAADRLRTPPVSILRLKQADGTVLPNFTGAHEALLGDLLAEGRTRYERMRRLRMQIEGEDAVAIDVLPTGKADMSDRATTSSSPRFVLSDLEFRALQEQSHIVPPEAAAQARQWKAELAPDTYAPRTVYLASSFYERLRRTSPELSHREWLLRYVQLLRAVDIRLHLEWAQTGEPLILFDSSLAPSDVRRLTINADLVEIEGESVRLPLLLGELPDRFVAAWYRGSEAVMKAHAHE